MDDNERLFESYLVAIDEGRYTGNAADMGGERSDVSQSVRDELSLVSALRRCHVSSNETDVARQRVHALLMNAIASDNARDESTDAAVPTPIMSSSRQRGRSVHGWVRAAAAAAALLTVGGLGGWQVSHAAASANPGSPMYSVKRLEERVSLDTAWSDQRRGQVLATIADHRLSEMTYEAGLRNQPLVRSLANEYDGAMRSLIDLTATMQRHHENTSVILAALSRELRAETNAMRSAQMSGDTVLSQALALSAQTQRDAISAESLDVMPPALDVPQNKNVPPNGAATPTTPPGQRTTQPQQHGNGSNNGQGNNSNNSNNSNSNNSNAGGSGNQGKGNQGHSQGGKSGSLAGPSNGAYNTSSPQALPTSGSGTATSGGGTSKGNKGKSSGKSTTPSSHGS